MNHLIRDPQISDFDSAYAHKRQAFGSCKADKNAIATLEDQAKKTATWLVTQHRHGGVPPAEGAVLSCLRSLQAIPDTDRLYADSLMDRIALVYLNSSPDDLTTQRRAHGLLRIAGAKL